MVRILTSYSSIGVSASAWAPLTTLAAHRTVVMAMPAANAASIRKRQRGVTCHPRPRRRRAGIPTRRRCQGSAPHRTKANRVALPQLFLPALRERLIVPHDAQQQHHGAAVERTGFERTGRRLAQARLQGDDGGLHIGGGGCDG